MPFNASTTNHCHLHLDIPQLWDTTSREVKDRRRVIIPCFGHENTVSIDFYWDGGLGQTLDQRVRETWNGYKKRLRSLAQHKAIIMYKTTCFDSAPGSVAICKMTFSESHNERVIVNRSLNRQSPKMWTYGTERRHRAITKWLGAHAQRLPTKSNLR